MFRIFLFLVFLFPTQVFASVCIFAYGNSENSSIEIGILEPEKYLFMNVYTKEPYETTNVVLTSDEFLLENVGIKNPLFNGFHINFVYFSSMEQYSIMHSFFNMKNISVYFLDNVLEFDLVHIEENSCFRRGNI